MYKFGHFDLDKVHDFCDVLNNFNGLDVLDGL